MAGIADAVGRTIERIRLTRLHEQRSTDLGHLAQVLASTEDVAGIVTAVTRSAPRVVSARYAVLTLVGEDGRTLTTWSSEGLAAAWPSRYNDLTDRATGSR